MTVAKDNNTYRGILASMSALALVSLILYLLSIFVLHKENGAMVAAIMLSGSVGFATTLLLHRLLKKQYSPAASAIAAITNLLLVTGGALFLFFSLIP